MPQASNDYKIALIIHTYLTTTGKPATARQLSQFLNDNDFPIKPQPSEKIAGIIRKYRHTPRSRLLSNIRVVQTKPTTKYQIKPKLKGDLH